MAWTKKHLDERWSKRFNEKKQEDADGVLVLKSEFNTAWNWFNAKELGETILGYWKTWYEKAESGELLSALDPEFPPPMPDMAGLTEVRGEFLTKFATLDGVVDDNGDSVDGVVYVPDVRKISLIDRRMIVSRKRTRNMFDLTSSWKRMVFQKLDERVLDERDPEAARQPEPGPSVPQVQATTLRAEARIRDRIAQNQGGNPRIIGQSDDVIILHQRSPSPNKPFFG
ncbi:hypothetical protein DICSQDRAFT_176216 [Dichomitus squalens LYAD-421 SS1]|uniref:Uncharacterized protein n=1 Tax=Dichomitus squalens (strain LYAD-421) TaxID=732165 RepID=R7SGH2_DICSQ|nr:uncharacterized protein DICSQDRAFT_176216 [Dichomitus squalens LYAD-421 SS1]EJF55244.1 hypothetical protein DICSQDRAFT_176216 [Dichomitus squalens LYAD-421 SS1]